MEGGGEDGTILGLSEEADAWDHVHTGSVDVRTACEDGEEGGYEMLYLGGSAEAVDLGGPGSQFGPLEGFRMRGGVARGSADGKVRQVAAQPVSTSAAAAVRRQRTSNRRSGTRPSRPGRAPCARPCGQGGAVAADLPQPAAAE